MTLGRPLGISGIGDCPPPDPLTTDPVALRLSEFFDQLTILGRQILSSNQLTDTRIDMFTDRLIALWDTMPDSLQFNSSWIQEEMEIPEWPMETRAASKKHSTIEMVLRANEILHSILLQYSQLHHPSQSATHRKRKSQSRISTAITTTSTIQHRLRLFPPTAIPQLFTRPLGSKGKAVGNRLLSCTTRRLPLLLQARAFGTSRLDDRSTSFQRLYDITAGCLRHRQPLQYRKSRNSIPHLCRNGQDESPPAHQPRHVSNLRRPGAIARNL